MTKKQLEINVTFNKEEILLESGEKRLLPKSLVVYPSGEKPDNYLGIAGHWVPDSNRNSAMHSLDKFLSNTFTVTGPFVMYNNENDGEGEGQITGLKGYVNSNHPDIQTAMDAGDEWAKIDIPGYGKLSMRLSFGRLIGNKFVRRTNDPWLGIVITHTTQGRLVRVDKNLHGAPVATMCGYVTDLHKGIGFCVDVSARMRGGELDTTTTDIAIGYEKKWFVTDKDGNTTLIPASVLREQNREIKAAYNEERKALLAEKLRGQRTTQVELREGVNIAKIGTGATFYLDGKKVNLDDLVGTYWVCEKSGKRTREGVTLITDQQKRSFYNAKLGKEVHLTSK